MLSIKTSPKFCHLAKSLSIILLIQFDVDQDQIAAWSWICSVVNLLGKKENQSFESDWIRIAIFFFLEKKS